MNNDRTPTNVVHERSLLAVVNTGSLDRDMHNAPLAVSLDSDVSQPAASIVAKSYGRTAVRLQVY